jgi:hypothetical protein
MDLSLFRRYSITGILRKEIPYLFTFSNVLIISAVLGGIQVFITIFLEPHGTDEYEATFRNLRLAGFSICFIGPFLLFYGIDMLIKKWQQNSWYVYNEVISKTLLTVAIATASFFYNITVINSISPTFQRWIDHLTIFAWPYIPLFIPFIILVYIFLFHRSKPVQKKVHIRGENKDDKLHIAERQFLYAVSDQNYVTIYYKKGDQVVKKQMRSSLQAIEDQLDSAVRIHRSYLINPTHLISMEGNARKRTANLDYIGNAIPVSASFDESALPNDFQ